jgi:dTMP kinase
LETLFKGTTVICSRWAYSGVAYSHAKGLDMNWCKHPDSGLPAPDVVIFLDVDVRSAKKRRQDEEIYDGIEMQSKVLESFRLLLKNEKRVKVNTSHQCSLRYVDGNQSIQDVHKECLEIAKQTIAGVSSKVNKLWEA